MKKLRLLLTLALIPFSSFAQEQKAASLRSPTHKDNRLAGANVLLLVEPDDIVPNPSGQRDHLGVNPRYGYFILDNIALGIDQAAISERSDQYSFKTLHTKLGAFGRYYSGKAFRKNGTIHRLRFFAEVGVAYGRLMYRDDYAITYDLLDLRIMPGINYFIKPRMALEFGLNGTSEFVDGWNKARYIYSANVGLQFFIARK